MRSVRALKAIVSPMASSAALSAFFKDTLQVPDINATRLVEELKTIQTMDNATPDVSTLRDIYLQLQRLCDGLPSEELQVIR
jgi:hypothetical protein